jgi:hypothetical protein
MFLTKLKPMTHVCLPRFALLETPCFTLRIARRRARSPAGALFQIEPVSVHLNPDFPNGKSRLQSVANLPIAARDCAARICNSITGESLTIGASLDLSQRGM